MLLEAMTPRALSHCWSCLALFVPNQMPNPTLRFVRSVSHWAHRAKPALRGGLLVLAPATGAAFAQGHVHSFCADRRSGIDMNMILSTHGPEAVRKIKELLRFQSDLTATWPPGKTVKITSKRRTLEKTALFLLSGKSTRFLCGHQQVNIFTR